MHRTKRHQRGTGTLLISILLLLCATLVLLYLNRGLLFEQRSSANLYRSTTAIEAAEAGVEWAIGMLNNPSRISANCGAGSSTDLSFRRRYADLDATPGSPDTGFPNVQPACRITSTGLSCSCPVTGSPVVLPVADTPSFSVSLTRERIASEDPPASKNSLRITAVGCSSSTTPCTAALATLSTTDASAVISVALKLRPLLRAGPAAPLTCGSSCQLGGSYNIINNSVATNGTLINAGAAISTGSGVALQTIPGLPPSNALVPNDQTLSALSGSDVNCNNSAVFQSYFGTTMQVYAEASNTKTITCDSGGGCGSLTQAAYDQGWRSFYFPAGLFLNNSSNLTGNALGNDADPVVIVTPGAFDINGNIAIHGVIFANNADVNDLGTGTADIHGGLITCAGYRNNGNGTLEFSDSVLTGAQSATNLLVKVPGSWRDER